MAKPSFNLNKYIPGQVVVEALGLSPDGKTSRQMRCPLCEQVAMRMANDATGGQLFFCKSCRFSADAITLYARARNIPLYDAVNELKLRTALPENAAKVWLPRWEHGTSGPQRKLVELLEAGRKTLFQMKDHHVQAMQKACAWWSRDFSVIQRTAASMVSGVHANELITALLPWRTALRARKLGDIVVLPFCDIFNRPRSLEILTNKGDTLHFVLPIRDETSADTDGRTGGVCFLDALGIEEDVVYAVEGGRFALQLKCQHHHDSYTPLPLIGWNKNTGADAWRYVRARKTILWAPVVTASVFRQAKRAANAMIATAPTDLGKTPDEIHLSLAKIGVQAWKAKVESSAVRWQTLLAKVLLEHESTEAINIIDEIGLTNEEATEVAEEFTGINRDRLLELFGLSTQSRTIQLDKSEISQAGNQWTEITKLGPRLIMDSVLYLDRVQVPLSGGPQRLIGYVMRGKETFPFRARLTEVQTDTAGFITRLMLAANQPLPQISPVWSRKLFRIAQTFHNPTTVRCIDKVSYIDEVGLVLPKFTVRDGKIHVPEETLDLDGASLPCQHLNAPAVPSLVDPGFFRPSYTTAAAWTLLASIICNIEAQRWGAESKGIVVTSADRDDVGAILISRIAEILSLPIYTYTPDIDFAAIDTGHAIPPIIDLRNVKPTEPKLLEYLLDPKPKSAILLVSNFNMWREFSLGGLIGIHAAGSRAVDFPYAEIPEALFTGLKYTQESNSTTCQWKTVAATRRDILSLVMPRLEVDDDARQNIHTDASDITFGDHSWQSTDTDRCMFPLAYIAKMTNFVPQPVGEKRDNLVTIPAGDFLKQFHKLTGFKPKLDDIRYHLRKAGVLRGMPDNTLEIPAVEWSQMLNRYRLLLPPKD
jgi:hypothetical protein